ASTIRLPLRWTGSASPFGAGSPRHCSAASAGKTRAIFGADTLWARPGCRQGPVDREVFARQQTLSCQRAAVRNLLATSPSGSRSRFFGAFRGQSVPSDPADWLTDRLRRCLSVHYSFGEGRQSANRADPQSGFQALDLACIDQGGVTSSGSCLK